MSSNYIASRLEMGLEAFPQSAEKEPNRTGAGGKPITSADVYACLTNWLMGALQFLKSIRISWDWRSRQSRKPMRLPKVRKLEDYPVGFPRLSCFLDSDDAFMVYRRFGSVFARLLLNKQDEISRMEASLLRMDKADRAQGNDQYIMSRIDDVNRESTPWSGESRTELLANLERKTLEYAELLLRARELKELTPPSTRDYTSVLNFMELDGGQLYERESEFIYDKEDLVTLRPGREYAWLDGCVERILQKCRCRLLRFIFASKETRAKTHDPDVHYYGRDRIRYCVTLIVTVMILILLMVPIYLLYHLAVQGIIATSPKTIGVIVIPTLLFSAVLSAFTNAKRHELLAASAGYCAVLVVFLGNINNNGYGPGPSTNTYTTENLTTMVSL